MPSKIGDRVRSHRDRLRASGLRPVQIWVPDTRRPGFDVECRRQSQIAALADQADTDLQTLQDEILADLNDE